MPAPTGPNTPFQHRHPGAYAFAFVAVISLMAGLLVAWNAQDRIASFTDSQRDIAEAAALSAANEIELLIGEKRRLVRLFAGQHRDEIAALAANPENDILRKSLEDRVSAYFPQQFAVTVADHDGNPLLVDFDQLVGDVCLNDLHRFADNDYLNDLFVHPHPEGYHFDIMAPWTTPGARGIFFVSFQLQDISRLLRHGEVDNYRLLLTRHGDPGLIEVADRGGRNQLQREPRLTKAELSDIVYRRPIPGTLWDMVVLPDMEALAAYAQATRTEAAGIMALFLLVSAIMLYLVGQAEHQRGRAERAQVQANRQLQASVQHLRETQDQLIEAEKLAALGGLVKGVAHEINTPLGVGVTAASHLREEVNTLASRMQDQTLTRADLLHFIETAQMANQMVVANLDRAVGLVRSFKQVASDQSEEQRRDFNVREHLDSLVTSLQPRLRDTPHQIDLDCPADLDMDSYPGALSQVIAQLTLNALDHGLKADETGTVSISCHRNGERIRLKCADNGTGMAAKVLSGIFDPFMTTERGHGYVGLGLHIVYNLVTGTLGGRINCESVLGKGTCFHIDLPLIAPDLSANTNNSTKSAQARGHHA